MEPVALMGGNVRGAGALTSLVTGVSGSAVGVRGSQCAGFVQDLEENR